MFLSDCGRAKKKKELSFFQKIKLNAKFFLAVYAILKSPFAQLCLMGSESLWSWLNLPRCIAVFSHLIRTLRNVCRQDSNVFFQVSIPSGRYLGCSRSNHHGAAWVYSTDAEYVNFQSMTPTICRSLLIEIFVGQRSSHHILKGPQSFTDALSQLSLTSLKKSCLATNLHQQSSAVSTASFHWWDRCWRCNSARALK